MDDPLGRRTNSTSQGQFRAVYGALWPSGGGIQRVLDPKVVSHEMWPQNGAQLLPESIPEFVSTAASFWTSRSQRYGGIR